MGISISERMHSLEEKKLFEVSQPQQVFSSVLEGVSL